MKKYENMDDTEDMLDDRKFRIIFITIALESVALETNASICT